MGSGIAAHLANAGIPVLMLDIVPFKSAEGEDTRTAAFRNKFATRSKAKLHKSSPAPLFTKRAADLITIGNFDDHMGQIADCDWVVEAIIENLDIKKSLFAKVEPHLKDEAIVSSNTSGLTIHDMLEGRSASFRSRFLVTHFFNPVRYMKLLELVPGPATDPAVLATMHRFAEETLGKNVVYCKDTPNFVANRIGVYSIMKTIVEMQKAEMSVVEVDAVFGPAMAKPKSAVFRTSDVVGVDTMVLVANNCHETLVDDEERDVFDVPPFLRKMVEQRLLGNKTKAGFYKRSKDESGKRIFLSLDLNTLEYSLAEKVRYPSLGAARKAGSPAERVKAVLAGDDKASKFAHVVTLNVLAYASRRIPEITDDLANIDAAVRGGFAWDLGPFQLWDIIGVQKGLDGMAELGIEPATWVAEMVAAGRESFYGLDGTATTFWDIPSQKALPEMASPRAFSLEVLRRGEKVVEQNQGATVWDMGDDVALLEFHTKMNAIDNDVVEMMGTALDVTERDFKGLVIGGDGSNFSVGANLGLVLMAAKSGQWDQIRDLCSAFQSVNQRLRYSPVPVVTAPAGLALGGGAEVTMAGNAVQAAGELYIGLVEVGVGLIPGGGGNLQLLRNLYGRYAIDPAFDPFPFIRKAFMTIGTAQTATSAEQGREMGFLNPADGVSMNRDFVLSDAKARIIGMSDSGFRPPRATGFQLPGPSGKATIDMMLYDMELNNQVSAHDRHIGSLLGSVLTGGDTSSTAVVSEERLLELELEAFLSLCGEEKTQARMFNMLQTGKPLRN
jgi:3-hydroxyacyl-CoA dehydrogenase